jgi:insulysin
MEIKFHIPYQLPLYRYEPSDYISHLVGHEGPGSILYFLQGRGLATALYCGTWSAGRGASLLNIELSLTKEGLREFTHPNCVKNH